MSDDRLRAAQRAWREARDDEREVRYLQELVRTGALAPGSLELAALLEHGGAMTVLGREPADAAEPEEWAKRVGEAIAAHGPEAGVRALVAAANWLTIRWENRFDGPPDSVMRVFELLDAFVLGDAHDRKARAEATRERLREAVEGTWHAGAPADLGFAACTLVLEPENAATLLPAALLHVARYEGDHVRKGLREELCPWLLGLEDPVRLRSERRGERFGAEPDLVRAVVFSRDGRRVVTTCRTGAVTLRDARTGAVERELMRRHSDTFAAAFSPDGAQVAACDLHGAITVWSADTGVELATWQAHEGGVTDLAFLPDGRLASVGYDLALRLWQATGGAALLEAVGHERGALSLAVSRDGTLAATASSDARVVLWDLTTGAARWTATHPAGVSDLAFTPDGATVITVADDGLLRRWHVASGLLIGEVRLPARSYALALSPAGDLAATVHDGRALLTRLPGGAAAREWECAGVQLAVGFAPDGRSFVVGARAGALRRYTVPPPPEE
jgi:hypothetical protein